MTAKHLIVPILSLAALIGWNSEAAALEPGKVQVVNVKGSPTVSNADGSNSKPLTTGASIQEGQRVVTGPESRAVLLFDNGSIFTVEEKTTFDISQFEIDPFNVEKVDYSKIKKEPSKSRTTVKISKGEVLGDIRKLNKGSKMDIATPLGVAGIRGTKIRISVTQNANGSFSVNFSVPEGSVEVAGPNGQSFPLGENAPNSANSVTFSATQNADGTFTLTGEPQYSTLTPEQVAAITSEMAQSESDVPSNTPGNTPQSGDPRNAPPPTNGATGGSGGGQSGDQGAINNGGIIGTPSS